jgi:hypothetical protein
MTHRNLIRSSLVLAGLLSFSTLAFARQPPSLVKAQDDASCAGQRAQRGAGYRHVFARFGGQSGTHFRSMTAGAGSGYRDARTRFSPTATIEGAACRTPMRAAMLR